MDVVEKRGDEINTEELSRRLGCKIVEISALKSSGIQDAAELAIEAARGEKKANKRVFFSGCVEHALAHIEEATVHDLSEDRQRWYAVKVFERDAEVIKQLGLSDETQAHIEKDIVDCERELDDDAESIITNERYLYITKITQACYKRKNAGKMTVSDQIDRIVTNRILALPIFAIVMFLVYFVSLKSIGDWTVGFMNDTLFGEWIIPSVSRLLADWGVAPWLISLIADGALSGVGAVLGFVPQMLILFLVLSILEDCGYMSRVAFIMDRLFRKFGLSGKSFIPLLVATGCGVPGIMASRTIEQERDRRMTVMTTGFIPCGAKMPIVGMIAGGLFHNSAWVAIGAYFIGVAAVVLSGLMLKKTKPFRGDPAPFVMELPSYHAPVPSNVFRATWERGWSFIKRAGTVIFAAGVIIWIFNSISIEGGLHYINEARGGASILENVGNLFAWIFAPLGFGNWQSAVATILGLLAKEQVVSTLGTLSSMANAVEGDTAAYATIAREFFGGSGLVGFSFMIFNLLCAPCFAAMGAIRREMNNWKWSAGAIVYMCGFAYAVSLIVYQLGSWAMGRGNILGTVVALILLGGMLYMLFRPNPNEMKKR